MVTRKLELKEGDVLEVTWRPPTPQVHLGIYECFLEPYGEERTLEVSGGGSSWGKGRPPFVCQFTVIDYRGAALTVPTDWGKITVIPGNFSSSSYYVENYYPKYSELVLSADAINRWSYPVVIPSRIYDNKEKIFKLVQDKLTEANNG